MPPEQHQVSKDVDTMGCRFNAWEDREVRGSHRRFNIPMVGVRDKVRVGARVRDVVPGRTGPIGLGKRRS